jgi:tetratricopeptide (TPR) repeat protein
VDIPVPKSVFDQFGIKDTALVSRGKISFVMNSTVSFGNVKAVRVQDLMVKDIVLANKWQRPIYFAISCGEDSRIGLDDYIKLEGLAYRLVPERSTGVENVNVELASKNLIGNNVAPSKTFQPGFIIRTLNNPNVFLDENMQRTTYGYRNAYMALANYYLTVLGDKQNCINTLNVMEQRIPRSHVEMDYRLLFNLATLYYNAGDVNTFTTIAKEVEPIALQRLAENPRGINSYYNPYIILKILYEYLGEYDKELDILNRMEAVAGTAPELEAEKMRVQKLKDSLLIKK